MYTRSNTKKITIGGICIGGGSRVTVQSMLNVPAHNFEENIRQAVQLEKAGCEIIRFAVPDLETVPLIYKMKEKVNVPLVADIHFDYKLALESVAAGIDKIRINPGNIGDDDRVKAVANACKLKNIPIRIGVNSGSVEKNILAKYGAPTPEALVESGLYHIGLLEKFDFDDIVLSLKSSNVGIMFDAYRLVAEKCLYPLHLGVTEAGCERDGIIKSSAGIGGLLLSGIGDTVRISLTDDPVKEVEAAKDLLKLIGIRKEGVRFVSCPTCGRTKIDLIALAGKVRERFKNLDSNITIAVMGCVVNGPGEASEADIGVAGGDCCGLIFKKGKALCKVPENEILTVLEKEVEKLCEGEN